GHAAFHRHAVAHANALRVTDARHRAESTVAGATTRTPDADGDSLASPGRRHSRRRQGAGTLGVGWAPALLSLAAGYAGPLFTGRAPVRAGWAQTLARGSAGPHCRRLV